MERVIRQDFGGMPLLVGKTDFALDHRRDLVVFFKSAIPSPNIWLFAFRKYPKPWLVRCDGFPLSSLDIRRCFHASYTPAAEPLLRDDCSPPRQGTINTAGAYASASRRKAVG